MVALYFYSFQQRMHPPSSCLSAYAKQGHSIIFITSFLITGEKRGNLKMNINVQQAIN
jgi:hypothetical protein